MYISGCFHMTSWYIFIDKIIVKYIAGLYLIKFAYKNR